MKKFIDNFELYIGTVMMTLMTVMLALQVISRYVFRHSITWTEEVAVFSFIFMAYYGGVAAIRRGQQLRLDIVMQFISPVGKCILTIIQDIISMIFMSIMVYGFWLLTEKLISSNVTLAMTRIPKKYIYFVVLFALFMFVIRCGQDAYFAFKKIGEIKKAEAEEGGSK